MAKVLDSTTINGLVQRMIETNNGYIIQGNYYDKSTLSPIPFKSFIAYGDSQDLSFNQSMFCQTTNMGYSSSKTMNGMVITDSENPDITYVFSNYQRGNATFYIMKIKETADEVVRLGTGGLDGSALPSTYSFMQQYMGQSKDYIFVIGTCYNSSYFNFYRISKTTLGIEALMGNTPYTFAMKFR